MLIILFFSAFIIYQSKAITQWEYLEGVRDNIIGDISFSESSYLETVTKAADYSLVRDKLYVYRKYWKHLTESLRAYDLESLNSYMDELARDNGIETVVVYRRDGDGFFPVSRVGGNNYLPEILYREIVQDTYGKVVYSRYPEGIYMNIIYPVFSGGNLVGLILFMQEYNESFLQQYADIYGIEFSLVSKGSVLINSEPDLSAAVKELLADPELHERMTFRTGSVTYTAIIHSFNLGGNAEGQLVLYSVRANVFGEDSGLIRSLIAMTLLCIMIPGVAFFLKELRLIRAINSLLEATDAISSGNYSGSVEVRSRDELGLLSSNFNQMVNVLKANRDELESRNRELALKNSYIDAVFQSLKINIIVLDPDMRIRVISRNAGSRLELNGQHTGQVFWEIEPFSTEEELLKKTLEQVYQRGSITRLYSVKFGNSSFEMDFYPVIEVDHNLSAVVIIMNNITERMNMERALIQSEKLASVGELAAGMAHEINNPMSVILNHVQLLKTDKLGDDDRTRFTERVESEIKRVSKLINNLLKFSKDETVQHERIKLGDIFSEVLGLIDPFSVSSPVQEFFDGYEAKNLEAECYRVTYKEKSLDFFLTKELVNKEIITGRNSLKQVLFNIIKNAIESTGARGGILWAGIGKEAEGMVIYLSDNGCGISSEELLRVFDLFYTRGKPGSGIGLGLPLCRKLMNSMDGEINIESEPGRGTRVMLLFPEREALYD